MTPWLLAPILAVVLLAIAIAQVPGKECEDLAFRYIDDTPPRDVVIGIATLASMLLGAAAVNRWVALERTAARERLQAPLIAVALVAPPLLALAALSSPSLASLVAIVGFGGSFGAVAGFFAVLKLQTEGVEASQASFYLPLYLGATAWCLIPCIAIVSLTLARHPICEFG